MIVLWLYLGADPVMKTHGVSAVVIFNKYKVCSSPDQSCCQCFSISPKSMTCSPTYTYSSTIYVTTGVWWQTWSHSVRPTVYHTQTSSPGYSGCSLTAMRTIMTKFTSSTWPILKSTQSHHWLVTSGMYVCNSIIIFEEFIFYQLEFIVNTSFVFSLFSLKNFILWTDIWNLI